MQVEIAYRTRLTLGKPNGRFAKIKVRCPHYNKDEIVPLCNKREKYLRSIGVI